MKQDIILAGVGGQGILLMAQVFIHASRQQGLRYKQPEIHGMSQRGGPVYSHLRLSDSKIWSDLIPKGEANIIISIEPMETLRYIPYLTSGGMVITGTVPVVNIPIYPDLDLIVDRIKGYENHILIDTKRLSKEAGSEKAQNMVMVGAASKYLVLEPTYLYKALKRLLARKGDRIIDINLKAFNYGRDAADFYHRCIEAGINADFTFALSLKRKLEGFDSKTINAWKEVFDRDREYESKVLEAINSYEGLIKMDNSIPRSIEKRLQNSLSEAEIQELFNSKNSNDV